MKPWEHLTMSAALLLFAIDDFMLGNTWQVVVCGGLALVNIIAAFWRRR